jgi:hypothetical protein
MYHHHYHSPILPPKHRHWVRAGHFLSKNVPVRETLGAGDYRSHQESIPRGTYVIVPQLVMHVNACDIPRFLLSTTAVIATRKRTEIVRLCQSIEGASRHTLTTGSAVCPFRLRTWGAGVSCVCREDLVGCEPCPRPAPTYGMQAVDVHSRPSLC